MKAAAHGLVIGKFYPPHAGHKLLVQTAAGQCERVTVVVMAASHESLALTDRVDWMREIHREDAGVIVTGIVDDVPVDYGDPDIWAQHVALMKEALASVRAPAVDAVFTSEPYGEELARRFDARAVSIDAARLLVPVSATRIRNDVAASWHFLEGPVRAALALKVMVVGAESTGTTTLSLDLAEALRRQGGADGLTRWVPEYGRAYSVQKVADAVAQAQLRGAPTPGFAQMSWSTDEFVQIARRQHEMQAAEARIGGPVLVCDTDVFATGVWHERYLGSRCQAVEALAEQGRGDLYLLTHHDGVPFEQDGIRDGEAIRAWMTQRFIERLRETGRPYLVLDGSREQRLAQAAAAVRELRAKAWQFARPLG
ncbi:MAG TPA: AAA family ATPase [Variovorax sp.]|nr:AAA family ATPase [Variovorax sp.]